MLTTRDVNEIADTEHDAVRTFDEKTKPKEPGRADAAATQQPSRMTYARVGKNGKVDFGRESGESS